MWNCKHVSWRLILWSWTFVEPVAAKLELASLGLGQAVSAVSLIHMWTSCSKTGDGQLGPGAGRFSRVLHSYVMPSSDHPHLWLGQQFSIAFVQDGHRHVWFGSATQTTISIFSETRRFCCFFISRWCGLVMLHGPVSTDSSASDRDSSCRVCIRSARPLDLHK